MVLIEIGTLSQSAERLFNGLYVGFLQGASASIFQIRSIGNGGFRPWIARELRLDQPKFNQVIGHSFINYVNATTRQS